MMFRYLFLVINGRFFKYIIEFFFLELYLEEVLSKKGELC